MGVLLELDGSSKMGVVGEAEKFAWKNRDGLEETEYKEGKWHVGMNVCTCVIRQARDQSAEQEMAITEQRGVCVCVVWKRTVVIDCRLINCGWFGSRDSHTWLYPKSSVEHVNHSESDVWRSRIVDIFFSSRKPLWFLEASGSVTLV